ncbi:conserved hypothetical protein [Paraburkholderia piptadeniae]|uniref:Uncharacterized protein n=2 Tax=Paraburkholderia TaxID=1822464 RepID=A0A7X1NEG7_9BURK|nr:MULTISPECIES: hypothetical protein [Paraburkholderia]MPW20425.1 hypothetical protein [Paraburkholderia franconis]SIT50936.1 conserved hypothetical protein [Paraburkholderia piptadeniae]
MALRVRSIPQRGHGTLSTAALIDLSLRNHLCLSTLRTEHGAAFHLGTIVRTMFASFFLFDAGYGDENVLIYSEVDLMLSELATSAKLDAHYSLGAHAEEPTARLLAVYDNQLQTAPLVELVAAHQRAERNFHASPEERLSIPTLIQRSKRRRTEMRRMQSTIIS